MGVWQKGPPPCYVCGKPGFKVRVSDGRIVCREHENHQP